MGNYYFTQGQFKVAERKYWQAVRENPCFALAHLNLACIYARHSDRLGRRDVDFKARAAEELHWAEVFNVGDVFGVQKAIAALRDELKIAPLAEAPALRFEDYRSADTLEARDLRAVGIFNAAMKYLRSDVERAKLMNNKAVYFKLKHKYDAAIDAYNDALRALGASVAEPVATQILDNAASLCTAQWGGGDEEYKIYKEYMQRSWRDGRR
jgi:tetratricopeptide (TPR) repeat protein